MAWDVEFTDDFGEWWDGLTAEEQDSVADSVYVLQESGPALTRPQADTIHGSPYRVLYAFDPRRVGVLLIGGDKTGNNRWYEEFVPKADAIYTHHLSEIEKD